MSKEELTIEEIDVEVIAKQLSQKYNCNVQPLVFQEKDNTEKIIGYLKEPSRILKARTLDAAASGSFTAGLTLFETCLLKDESDPRLYSDKSEHDAIVLGGALAAIEMIQLQVNTFIKVNAYYIDKDSDEYSKIIALLQYYSHFSLDVDNLSDDELALKWCQLSYALTQTNQMK